MDVSADYRYKKIWFVPASISISAYRCISNQRSKYLTCLTPPPKKKKKKKKTQVIAASLLIFPEFVAGRLLDSISMIKIHQYCSNLKLFNVICHNGCGHRRRLLKKHTWYLHLQAVAGAFMSIFLPFIYVLLSVCFRCIDNNRQSNCRSANSLLACRFSL